MSGSFSWYNHVTGLFDWMWYLLMSLRLYLFKFCDQFWKNNLIFNYISILYLSVARDVNFIPTARVPVLQYVSNHFGISCDRSTNNYPGWIKSRVLYWINTLDSRFGDMVLLVSSLYPPDSFLFLQFLSYKPEFNTIFLLQVKEWAKAQNINDPKNGTLNSYSLCLLVLFHFQVLFFLLWKPPISYL